MAAELLIATNPDPDSSLGYLMLVPLGDGLVLRTSGTWPRTKALYCYPVPASEWPEHPEIVERVALRSVARRGAAVDLVAARSREQRSQLVFTTARGRDAVFWQSPRTRKQARPQVSLPTARAAGLAGLEIVVDAHERYPYRFAAQQAVTTRRALPCGDYAVLVGGALAGAVERKSLSDLVSSVSSGRLRFALGELAALPRAAVVVEDRYSAVFKQQWMRPAAVADALAELQVRWPGVPIVFAETRPLAEEWTYRYLAAAHVWASEEPAAAERVGVGSAAGGTGGVGGFGGVGEGVGAPAAAQVVGGGVGAPAAAQVRHWARQQGLAVPDRGRIPASVRAAWEEAHSAGAAGGPEA